MQSVRCVQMDYYYAFNYRPSPPKNSQLPKLNQWGMLAHTCLKKEVDDKDFLSCLMKETNKMLQE